MTPAHGEYPWRVGWGSQKCQRASALHDLQRSDSLPLKPVVRVKRCGRPLARCRHPSTQPCGVALSRSCGSWLGRCMALAADATARGNSEASEGSALYSFLAFCYPSIADPEDSETEGLLWQPDFIGDRSRSRHLVLTQAAKPQSPQSFTDSPPYSPLFWFEIGRAHV